MVEMLRLVETVPWVAREGTVGTVLSVEMVGMEWCFLRAVTQIWV
jgi:hypothetical protein